jgi:hypothetical protein
MRLHAQYGSMVRTSLSVHRRLMRVQASRRQRGTMEGAANEDPWALHVAEQPTLAVVDADTEALEAAQPKVAPAACADERVAEIVSESGTNSQGTAFETSLSAQPWNRSPQDRVKCICARLPAKRRPNRVWPVGVSGCRKLPANGR